MNYRDATHLLVIEVKAHGGPRFVRAAVHQLESLVAHMPECVTPHRAEQFVPILVTPYLSPESRVICRDHDIAYLGRRNAIYSDLRVGIQVPIRVNQMSAGKGDRRCGGHRVEA